MIKGDHTRSIAGTALAVLCVLTLVGCAGSASSAKNSVEGDYPDVALNTSKGATQLLLNDLIGRVDSSQLESLGEQTSVSMACLSTDKDPDGTIRRWDASVQVHFVHPEYAQQIADEIIRSYIDLEWGRQAVTGATADSQAALLTNFTSLAKVQIEVNSIGILFDATGPCVRTDGQDSDEVKTLEGRS